MRFELGEGDGGHTRVAVKGECSMGAGLTIHPAGTWFGVAQQTCDLEARFVIAVQCERVKVYIGAQQHGTAVPLGVHHKDHTQIAWALDMGDDLGIEHDVVIVRLKLRKAREVSPVHLAVVGLGASWAGALWPMGERAPMGIRTHLANLAASYSPDTTEHLLLAVLAIGDDIA